eukprot:CAMPEP_0114602326 /NCGR_PEP_ID=MMETSP0125-20121206/24913_1 /TAXON_ID=485358 ORGANISM="Aristerostoma sp., Strain ATCC 50986" /NCGR_SAMPLE_ID=MMETSP0125 /ASSEMBLY_ACC=CAM_ASM_000245 /LENGTH=181 /DNA_ID=CAMNT_0001812379 /DNA_START=515 /DNA_END=1057 /DNA_ORIENTATION=+
MKGLAALTGDREYQVVRQRMKNRKIKSIREGFVFGIKYFLKVIASALFSIFTKPCLLGKQQGCVGFIIGLWVGLSSLALKPIVGIYDLIMSLVQGVKNSAKYEEHVMDRRSRPPRTLSAGMLIEPYNWNIAMGKDVLRKLKSSKKVDDDKIAFYDEIQIPKRRKTLTYQVIITDQRFIHAK